LKPSSTLVLTLAGLMAAAIKLVAANMGIVYTISSVHAAIAYVGIRTMSACVKASLRSCLSILVLSPKWVLQPKKNSRVKN